MPSFLLGVTDWWSSCYADHRSVSVLVRYVHLVGLILAGGTALYADRQILSTARAGSAERQTALAGLHGVHRHVISAIFVIAFTGALMTVADSKTFFSSGWYWTKMALVALLALNGAAMILLERRAQKAGVDEGWMRLVAVSGISAVLWLTVLFLGTVLTVAA